MNNVRYYNSVIPLTHSPAPYTLVVIYLFCINKQITHLKAREGRKSDLQRHDVVQFKCPGFKKKTKKQEKNHEAYKERGKKNLKKMSLRNTRWWA